MSNSDKYQQDEAIVPDSQVGQQLEGVLNGPDEPFTSDEDINAPEPEGGDYESVRGNEISKGEFENDEFDGVREENIIDGERSTRAKNFAQADEEADRVVEEVAEANIGRSSV
ncbi:hypothetical protein JCM10449v2_003299 [Rhodotorula kratochvilovae]